MKLVSSWIILLTLIINCHCQEAVFDDNDYQPIDEYGVPSDGIDHQFLLLSGSISNTTTTPAPNTIVPSEPNTTVGQDTSPANLSQPPHADTFPSPTGPEHTLGPLETTSGDWPDTSGSKADSGISWILFIIGFILVAGLLVVACLCLTRRKKTSVAPSTDVMIETGKSPEESTATLSPESSPGEANPTRVGVTPGESTPSPSPEGAPIPSSQVIETVTVTQVQKSIKSGHGNSQKNVTSLATEGNPSNFS